MEPVRLWDVTHPYYCSESNYYSREPHESYGSWADFHSAMGASDPELNLLFRWDWQRYGIEDGDWNGTHTLQLFFVLQRKGIFACHEVTVTEDDEPAIREWLTSRLPHALALWAPLVEDRTKLPPGYEVASRLPIEGEPEPGHTAYAIIEQGPHRSHAAAVAACWAHLDSTKRLVTSDSPEALACGNPTPVTWPEDLVIRSRALGEAGAARRRMARFAQFVRSIATQVCVWHRLLDDFSTPEDAARYAFRMGWWADINVFVRASGMASCPCSRCEPNPDLEAFFRSPDWTDQPWQRDPGPHGSIRREGPDGRLDD